MERTGLSAPRVIASLREYVLVSHREKRVDHYLRLDSGQWLATTVTDDQGAVELPNLKARLALADVYDRVDLNEGGPSA